MNNTEAMEKLATIITETLAGSISPSRSAAMSKQVMKSLATAPTTVQPQPETEAMPPEEAAQPIKRSRGTGSIYRRKDSPNLWIKYSRAGRTYHESVKTTDPRKAQLMLQSRLGSKDEDFLGPEVRRVRIDALAEDLVREYRINHRKSIDALERRWNLHLKPFFGGRRAFSIDSTDIARYVDHRQQEGAAANATINRELAALRTMLYLGRARKKLGAVPDFELLEENNARQGFAEEPQINKLFEHCSELWFRTFVELARTYGWRKSELLNLRVKQVDLAGRIIRLEPGTTKNKAGRTVRMTQSAFVLLSACIAGKKPDQYVLTRADGKRVKDFRGTWRNACIHAGCPGLLVHDLRRTGARDLRRAGVAEAVIMRIGGWKTRSVFERYNIVDESDLQQAVEKLERSRSELSYVTATIEPNAVHSANSPAERETVN